MPQHQDPNMLPSARVLIWTGAVFLALGAGAIAVPAAATLAVEQVVAVLLLVWGAAGIGLALSLRPAQDWLMTAALFAGVSALGVIFMAYPRSGAATMTMLLVAVFLIEGIASTVIGLRLRPLHGNWFMLVLSGLSSLLLGGLVIAGWPETSAWTLGLLTGINFLTTGLTLVMMGRSLTAAK